ncbi:hypothetical protein [Burkholderia multivorans]|uniref:hypothetical protein n=1 Tax=Burkholderia multivorans TaxID=87883 RepID=UPI002158F594|nr:hypothetical protein [Burkholderia multivorans]
MAHSPFDPVETRYEAARRAPPSCASVRRSRDEPDDAAAYAPLGRENAGSDIGCARRARPAPPSIRSQDGRRPTQSRGRACGGRFDAAVGERYGQKRRLRNGGMRIARGIAAWRAFYRARGAEPGNRRRRAEDGRLAIECERQRARRAA